MKIQINADDPIGSLKAAGCSIKHALHSTTYLGPTRHGETFRVTLPSPARVQATFSVEAAGNQFLKLFWKEPQTGDAEFDAKVFIATDDVETTNSFLSDTNVRNTIFNVVSAGGSVSFKGTNATFAFKEITGKEEMLGMSHVIAAAM